MGAEEGEPVVFYWPVYYHFAWLLPFLLLLGLVLRPVNRLSLGAWLLLLAVLALSLGNMWGILQNEFLLFFAFLLDSVAIYFFAMSFLWLLADRLSGRSYGAVFGYALLLLAIAGLIGLVGVSGFGLGLILIPTAFGYALVLFIALISILLAALACHKRYSPLRYFVWLAVICIPGMGGIFAVLSGLMTLLSGLIVGGAMSVDEVVSLLANTLMSGLLGGLVVFLLVLPFMALALWSPVFRPRFHAIFRLPGMDFEQGGEYNEVTEILPADGQRQSGDEN